MKKLLYITLIFIFGLLYSCDSKMDYEEKHDWVIIDSSRQYRSDNVEDVHTYNWRLDNRDTIKNYSRIDLTKVFESYYNNEKGCAFTNCKVEVKYPDSEGITYFFERKGSFNIIK